MGEIEARAKKYLSVIKEKDKKIKAFLSLNSDLLSEARKLDKKKGKRGKLYGKIIGVKSNINVSGLIANCASKTLQNYKAGYDATVIEKIKTEDGLIIGMLNMDEFASGSGGDTGAFGACGNPRVPERVPGGSSSGAAAAVAAGMCDLALGTDTGGSIRLPSSFCGVVGVKPSYGRVSRYGLIDLSMSLDQIGSMAKNVDDATLLLSVIAGKDEKDQSSLKFEAIKMKKIGKMKVGVVRLKGINKKVQNVIDWKLGEIEKKLGWSVSEVDVPGIELAVQTYYPMVYVEFFSGTRKFDGRRFGKKIEESCGAEVLRRIEGGREITRAEYKGQYYEKALSVKKMIKAELERVLKKVDCLIMPTCPDLPWHVSESKKMTPEEVYSYDALTIPANLAGACAISIPCGSVEKVPVGLQIVCGQGQDSKMMGIAKEIEKLSK
tara:strand:+ start:3487 stop:4794 length:1308 start_codon:yes stop_codon:yes gene_type:complete